MSIAVPVFKSFFVETPASCTYQGLCSGGQISISLKITPLVAACWQVTGVAKFIGERAYQANIPLREGRAGQALFFGSWEDVFAGKSVNINLKKALPLELISEFANQTLCQLHFYANGVRLQSDYLSGEITLA